MTRSIRPMRMIRKQPSSPSAPRAHCVDTWGASARSIRKSIYLAIATIVLAFLPASSEATTLPLTENGDLIGNSTFLDSSLFTTPSPADAFQDLPTATVTGDLYDFPDVDWVSFVGVAGATFYADLDFDVGASGPFPDFALSLFAPGGTLALWGGDSGFPDFNATNRGQDPGSDSGLIAGDFITLDPFIGVYILPASGTWHLAISDEGTQPTDIFDETAGFGASLTPPGSGNTTGLPARVGNGGGFLIVGGTGDTSFSGGFGNGQLASYTVHITMIPEPSTLALIAVGLAALAVRRRKRA